MKFIIHPHCRSLKEFDLFVEEHGWGECISSIYPKFKFELRLQKEDLPREIPMTKDTSIKAIMEYDLTENQEIAGLLYFIIDDARRDHCIVTGTYQDWVYISERVS